MNARKYLMLIAGRNDRTPATWILPIACLVGVISVPAFAAPPGPFPGPIRHQLRPAAISVVPATFLPANVASVPGMCSAYNADIASTGAIGANGTHHPGDCRFTDLDTLLEGLPAAQYWQGVSAGSIPAPYTVTVSPTTAFSTCATVGRFNLHVSARVLTSALQWPPNRPAGSVCATQWAQHDPLQLVSSAALQSQVGTFLSQYAGELQRIVDSASPIQACAMREKFDPQSAAREAQRMLAAKVAQLLAAVDNQQQARWSAVRTQFEGPATQSMCALRCNVCDPSGWSGTIVMNETIDSTAPNVTFHHTETDTFYVGGTAQVANAQTLIPFDWTAVGSGTASSVSGSRNWTENAAAAGNCAPQPPGGCLLVLSQAGMLKFSGENSPFTVQNGITLTQTSNGSSSTGQYGASETQFPLFSVPAGATSATGQTTLHPATCYAPLVPSPYTCTQQWSWNLSFR